MYRVTELGTNPKLRVSDVQGPRIPIKVVVGGVNKPSRLLSQPFKDLI